MPTVNELRYVNDKENKKGGPRMPKVQKSVEIIDVGPRDGLQNESEILDVSTKVAFISKLCDAGLKRIEAVSFVNPERVPQMADAEEVFAALPVDDGVTYIGLVFKPTRP